MNKDQQDRKNQQHPPNKGNENTRQPDPETLGTADPEEHMEGPVSSIMQKIKEEAEENNPKAEPAPKDKKKE